MNNEPIYNTDINIIGSIPDYQVIYRVLELLATTDLPVERILEDKNEFDFRTERSRDRFLRGIRYGILPVKNEDHNELLLSIYRQHEYNRLKGMFLLWQISINNAMVFEITRDVFLNYYFAGKVTILQKDIVFYIKDKFSKDKKLKDLWTEETIKNVARKYLAFMSKIGLVEGKNNKSFIYYSITNQELVIFCYLLMVAMPDYPDLISNPLLNFSLLEKESFIEKVKAIAKKDWIHMTYTGSSLKVEPIQPFNKIINVLYD